MASRSSSPTRPSKLGPEAPAPIRERLPAARVAEMRELVEGTTRSYKRIGEDLGVSVSTVSRYATQEGWQRPPSPALPDGLSGRAARVGIRREWITEKLWKLAERHVEELEDQPVELAQRSLQPLARLTRVLGDIERHARPGTIPEDPCVDPEKPRRSLHEMRDELLAHLERIEREERDYEERWGRTFENGGGI